jgi:competence protein ComEC
LVLAPLAARLLAHQSSTLAGLANKRSAVIADVTIGGEPHLLTSAGFAGSARMVVAGQVRGVRVAGREVDADGPVLILGPAEPWQHLLSGQRVRVDARLQPPLPGDLLTATLIPEADPQLIGQPPWWQRGAASVRASLRAASAGLPRDIAGLLPGLIVGDTSNLDPVLAERFKIAGLTHLVAVSGVNELWG